MSRRMHVAKPHVHPCTVRGKHVRPTRPFAGVTHTCAAHRCREDAQLAVTAYWCVAPTRGTGHALDMLACSTGSNDDLERTL